MGFSQSQSKEGSPNAMPPKIVMGSLKKESPDTGPSHFEEAFVPYRSVRAAHQSNEASKATNRH